MPAKLSLLGLAGVRNLLSGYDALARLNFDLVAITITVAILSAILAGLYPTWRICQLSPSKHLKTQ